jgi:hypothetical protein
MLLRSVHAAPSVLVRSRFTVLVAGAVVLSALPLTTPLGAQAANVPSLQVPTASVRDYTAAVSGGSGTTVLFQWREGWTPRRHWQLDAGLADRSGSDQLALTVGGGLGQEVARATPDQPLDLLFTAGAYAALGGGSTLLRFPVGMSIGHTFPLEDGMALTPFVHPRASLDLATGGERDGGTGRGGQSEVSLHFDVGMHFQVNRQLALRAAAAFTGAELAGARNGFALGLNWTPAPLVRR